MKGPASSDILPLTGVRFLAVAMIFLFHYSYKLVFAGEFVTGIFHQLYLGVQVFFVLSGFVICYKYFDGAELNKNFILTYYLRRFARIYPLFFLLTTFTFIVWYFKSDQDSGLWKIYLLNISFVKGLSAKYYLTGIGPSWSLTVEEIFYFFSPLIFLLIKRKNILFGQIPFWWALGGIFLLVFSAFPFGGFFQNAHFVFFVTFFGRCFEFYLGIFLALYIMGTLKWKRFSFPKFSFPLYTIAGLFCMALIIILIYKTSQFYHTVASETWAGIFLTNIIFPLAVFFFFFGLIKESSMVQKLFSTSLFQLLGKSSYAFFLIHTGVIATGIEKYVSQNLFILFIVLQLVSIVIYKAFEKPVNSWTRLKGQGLIRKFIS